MQSSHSPFCRGRPKEPLCNTAAKDCAELQQSCEVRHASPIVELKHEIEAIS
jgi:hypothetical protein